MTDLIVRPSTKSVKIWYVIAVLLAIALLVGGRSTGKDLRVLLAVPVLLLAWAAVRHMALRFTTLTIGDGKLRYQDGMMSRSTRTLELSKIQDVRVDQSIGARMLGLGNLTLETAGESGRLTMLKIDNPQTTADHILELARKRPV